LIKITNIKTLNAGVFGCSNPQNNFHGRVLAISLADLANGLQKLNKVLDLRTISSTQFISRFFRYTINWLIVTVAVWLLMQPSCIPLPISYRIIDGGGDHS